MAFMSSELESLRQKIDDADCDIVEALGKRMKLVDEVGAYKKAHGMDTVDEARLQDILSTRAAWGAGGDLSPDFVRELFTLIHEEAVEREERA